MKKFLTLILIFNFSIIHSQTFYKSKLIMEDGTTKEGLSELPKNTVFNNALKFKLSDNSKSESIKYDGIKKIIYTLENGMNHSFEKNKIRTIYKLGKKLKERISKEDVWLSITVENEYINLYNTAQVYYVDKKNILVSKTVDNGGTWAEIGLYLKRSDEQFPTYISSVTSGAFILNKESQFRNVLSNYFEGIQELQTKISNKDFKSENLEDVVKAYVEYKTKRTE